jgi:hypothetical protein
MADAWWTIDDAPAVEAEAAPVGIREQIPDGEHELQVLQQSAEADRLALRLTDTQKRWSIVFVDFYKAKKDGTPNTRARAQMAQLATALGMNADQWVAAVQSGDLVGRRVICQTRQYQAGERTRVAVDKFTAAPPAPPAGPAKAKPKTAAQKITASIPDDDIPF